MPELPEIETIKRQLEKKLVGLKIEDIEIKKKKMFIGKKGDVLGRRIEGVERRAKMLLIKLFGGYFLIIHLKMSGQLVYAAEDREARRRLPVKTTHIIFYFNNGARLFFNDLRQFGWVKAVKNKEVKIINNEFGPEPFSREFTADYLAGVCKGTERAIKLVLMDQTKLAGVGNIYANDALFVAKIRPMRKGDSLAGKEVKSLFGAVRKVLKKGIEAKGASGADGAYINIKGEKGKYRFLVYQREGKNCLNSCGAKIKRIKLGSRGTFYCPKCQK